jgi:peptidyl-prolyl cis-trans isomerase D
MLRGIRKASSNWLGRTVMGVVMTVLAGSFAVWGINDIFRGYSNSSVAKVGATEIPIDQFQQTYNDRVQQLSQQFSHPITADEANALGIGRQVLGQMVADAALDQFAHQMRLGIPDAEIAQRITSDPHFRTPTGEFDRAQFQNFLRNIGFTEQRFVDQQRREIPRREITQTLAGDFAAPRALLDAVNQFQNQQRSIQYLEIGPEQAGDIPQPTPEELSKYFNDRKILFRAPEYRKVVTLTVTPAELAKSIEVSDEDVASTYKKNISAYITPERRHIEQMVFPTMAQAQAASTRINSGVSFTALAAERGLKEPDIDLGTVAKTAIVDPAVANAAFSLKAGEVSAPVQGNFGAVIVTVLSIEPQVMRPLDAVAPFVRNDIALQRASTKVQDIHDKIEDARAGSSTLQEAAQRLNLPVVTLDAVDRSGRDPAGKLIATMPGAPNVIGAAFASDVGVDNDPIAAEGGYVWYNVDGITPAHDRTLDEVKGQVEQSWRDDQIATRLKTKAADILDKLKNGNPLDALASADGLKLQTGTDLKRGVPSVGVPGRLIDAAFRIAKDGYGSTVGENPTQWFVFKVGDVKTPNLDTNSADGKKLDQLLQGQVAGDIYIQYMAWLENHLGITVNQAALAQATSAAPEPE